MSDPLRPHLVDLVSGAIGDLLILAGGYGLMLKRRYLSDTGQKTLMETVPDTRATIDLDFFLRLEVFIQKNGGVRARLDELGYTVLVEKLQFQKLLPGGQSVKVDLLAGSPRPDAPSVKVSEPRVGSGIGVHGRITPEAFAVEDSPVAIPVEGVQVWVPHPFAWIVMKTVAAGDWLRNPAKPYSEKHAYDVYLHVAMVTAEELAACQGFQQRHARHPMLQKAREDGQQLFGTETSAGFLEASRQAGRGLEYRAFWDGYSQIIGLA
jgi:hypothetical protein